MNRNLIEYLVRQAQNGNHEAFNQLAESFSNLAHREAFRWLGDVQSAEDATQDAFIAAYKHLSQLRNPSLFGAWFRQIVRSQCNLQTRRKSYPTEAIEEQSNIPAPTPNPEQVLEKREVQEKLRKALDALPEHERQVTEDYYLKGKKQSEIAKKLGVPVSTIKKRLQYARKRLKGLIKAFSLNLPASQQWRDYEQFKEKLLDILFPTPYPNLFTYR